ncbi:hypothetical protein MBOURGENBZM_14360 [Methanoculleus bourgensis]|nr:hypothetical protein MBOURGENBZM_14360 [Methanoculleus bourgensis]
MGGRGGEREGSAPRGMGRRPDMVCQFGIVALARKRHTERFFLVDYKLPLFFARAIRLCKRA